ERLELRGEQLAVRADAGDVAIVVHVVGGEPAIEDAHLRRAGRSGERRRLRAGIVEGLERIRRTVDGDRRDLRAVEPVEHGHGRAVRPSDEVDPARVDLARRDLGGDEVVDGRSVDVLRVEPSAGDAWTTRGIELAVPVVPAGALIVGRGIEVRRRATLR